MAELSLDALQTVASTATVPAIIITQGVAPTTPANGWAWTTSAGLFLWLGGALKTVVFNQSHIVRGNRVVTGAGPITVTTADDVITVSKTVRATTAINLPSSPVSGDQYTFIDGNGDANVYPWTINPASGLILGLSSINMSQPYGSITVMYNGTGWSVL